MYEKIDMFLELYPDLEEAFEVLDIEPSKVIQILLKGGHVKLPEYMDDIEVPAEDE